MGKDLKEQDRKIEMIIERFDQILTGHIERLLGSRMGPGGLPLNLMTVSCLTFLAEQQGMDRNDFSTSAGRYTRETLFSEIEQIGLGSGMIFQNVMADLLEKKFIRIDGVGHITGEKSVQDTAGILNHIFPKMPGLNFIAYIAQTIDETASGRKDLEDAIGQFDQTLLLQGAPINIGRGQSDGKRGLSPGLKTEVFASRPAEGGARRKPAGGNLISAEKYRQVIQAKSYEAGFSVPVPKILSTDAGFHQADVREISFGEAISRQDEPDPISEEADEPSGILNAQVVETDAAVEANPKIENEISSPPAKVVQKLMETAHEKDIEADAHAPDDADTVIERKISSFEEDLALQCPQCRTAKIVEEKTLKGKMYYKCSSRNCNFISWGKPYHQVCPRCNNPFLIESERNGEMVLKCPRATCSYRQTGIEADTGIEYGNSAFSNGVKKQPAATPVRRVVKRRVVRKKR